MASTPMHDGSTYLALIKRIKKVMSMENSIILNTPQQAADYLGIAYQQDDREVISGRIKGRVSRSSSNEDTFEIYGETQPDLQTGQYWVIFSPLLDEPDSAWLTEVSLPCTSEQLDSILLPLKKPTSSMVVSAAF